MAKAGGGDCATSMGINLISNGLKLLQGGKK